MGYVIATNDLGYQTHYLRWLCLGSQDMVLGPPMIDLTVVAVEEKVARRLAQEVMRLHREQGIERVCFIEEVS